MEPMKNSVTREVRIILGMNTIRLYYEKYLTVRRYMKEYNSGGLVGFGGYYEFSAKSKPISTMSITKYGSSNL